MSTKKRKAAMCSLIAAAFLALEKRRRRMLELMDEDESKHYNSSAEENNISNCDEEENEKEIYKTQNDLGFLIKVEPGLSNEDSNTDYHTYNEELKDPLDTAVGGIQIKEEPESDDDDDNDDSNASQDYAMDSGEGCSKSRDIIFNIKPETKKFTISKNYQINHIENEIQQENEVKDDCQIFGELVAQELRNLRSEDDQEKLKRIIQKVILKIPEL